MKHFLKPVILRTINIGVYLFGPLIKIKNFFNKRKIEVRYSNIVEGFANHIFDNPQMEVVAKQRAKICATCPFAKQSNVMKVVIVDNKTKEIQGLYCDACGCNLSAKVRSNTYCPKGKW